VYVLGCRAQRVTVLSQQFRAFNLVWALFKEGLLRPGNRVGVVGGGIGGLTAAAAAMIKGCSVVVTEQRQQLMHLQRRNTTRLLHPNIYEWPSAGSEDSSTRFPCMNWMADLAGEVVSRLDSEWEYLAKEFSAEVHTEMCITAIEPDGSDGRLVLCKGDEWMSDPCDAVIVAIGFGVEPPVRGLVLDSYWENDSLEQPVRGSQQVRSVLVSGLGDGGCIDVLRLKYANFQHTKFADVVARHYELERYKDRLLEIEGNMPRADREKYLREEYAKLELPVNLAESLGKIRSDTNVVLNGPDPTSPLSPNACILHRVAIWALVIGNKVEYKPSRINKTLIKTKCVSSGIKYYVPFQGSGNHGFDTVVIRHGPDPCLSTFPQVKSGYSGITETVAEDRTRGKMYPDDFYPTRQFSPSAARTLDAESKFMSVRIETLPSGGEVGIPLPAEFSIGPPGSARLNVIQNAPNAHLLSEIVSLIGRLTADTRAENYLPAVEAASVLDALLVELGTSVPHALWHRSHMSLFDFECYVRKRIESSGGKYEADRLQHLLRRMRRENA
jgi:hypothetical protein